jgi:hypothetical protein
MQMPPANRSLSASTAGKRAHLRRWAISIAFALLLHGVVAMAVLLTWQKSTTPLHPNGPVIVELPPPPAAPLGEAVPAPPKAGIEAPSAAQQIEANRAPGGPPKQADEITERKVASSEEGSAEPTFATQSLAPTAPLENAEGENGADVRTASGGGGGVRSAPSGGEAAGGPIDTRIGHFGPGSKKVSRTLARKPIRIGRAAKDAGMQGHSRHLSAQAGVVINAIGAHVQDRVSAAGARANGFQEGPKNAIGSNVANLAGSISANAADLAVTNAIGIAVRVRPSIPGPVIAEHGAGAIAFAGGSMPKAAINGTGMSRIGLGVGVIGGPAKNVAGVLNGTSFRPRHP